MKTLSNYFFAIIFLFVGKIILAQVTNMNYKTVVIGSQTWMAENLDVDKFRNGDSIPEAKTNDDWTRAEKEGKSVWCYYLNKAKNKRKYGRIYNIHAVNDLRGLTPIGWHIPTMYEWKIFENVAKEIGLERKRIVRLLKRMEGNPRLIITSKGTCDGSFCKSLNVIHGSKYSKWWSSDNGVFNCYFKYFENGTVSRSSWSGIEGYTVRCVKD